MPMTLSGDGTITGLAAGGLPDSSIVTADIANASITAAKLDGAQNGSAPIYAARAWVNFNGTGTVAIRASGNVSSITDNGTGDYTLNFATAMPDANYSVAGSANDSAGSSSYVWLVTGAGLYSTILRSTTQVRIQSAYVSTGVADASTVNVVIFR
jgi:hypothetical protein